MIALNLNSNYQLKNIYLYTYKYYRDDYNFENIIPYKI